MCSQADVHDHMEYILSSLDMIAGITENLINYTFNVRALPTPRRLSAANGTVPYPHIHLGCRWRPMT